MSLAEKLLGVIAPPTCLGCGREGSPLCEACASVKLQNSNDTCYACGRLIPGSKTCSKCARLGGPKQVWINVVYAGLAERLVEDFKFNSSRPSGRFMAELMAKRLPQNLDKNLWILVPIPTASSRIRQRGFDHVALLTKTLARQAGLNYRPALARIGQVRQVGASRSERFAQAQASYRVRYPKWVEGRHVILVDDVVTTGATLRATTKLLRQAGAKSIDAIAFAKRL